MVNVAERAPLADGVNVKTTVQEPLIAMVPPLAQVPAPVLEKFVGLVPVIVK
jgi:hypothetical protein